MNIDSLPRTILRSRLSGLPSLLFPFQPQSHLLYLCTNLFLSIHLCLAHLPPALLLPFSSLFIYLSVNLSLLLTPVPSFLTPFPFYPPLVFYYLFLFSLYLPALPQSQSLSHFSYTTSFFLFSFFLSFHPFVHTLFSPSSHPLDPFLNPFPPFLLSLPPSLFPLFSSFFPLFLPLLLPLPFSLPRRSTPLSHHPLQPSHFPFLSPPPPSLPDTNAVSE